VALKLGDSLILCPKLLSHLQILSLCPLPSTPLAFISKHSSRQQPLPKTTLKVLFHSKSKFRISLDLNQSNDQRPLRADASLIKHFLKLIFLKRFLQTNPKMMFERAPRISTQISLYLSHQVQWTWRRLSPLRLYSPGFNLKGVTFLLRVE
jgi:hypothetical protein